MSALNSRLIQVSDIRAATESNLMRSQEKCTELSSDVDRLRLQLTAEEERSCGLVKELSASSLEIDQLKVELSLCQVKADGYSEELRKQREVLSYINKISAENEALRRLSSVQ